MPEDSAANATDLGVVVQLIYNGKNLWKSLPDGSDLAAVALPDMSRYKSLHAIGVQDFGNSDDFFQGADIVALVYPIILGEDYLRTPLARGGTVSWTDPIDPINTRFLIDSNVFNGNSGGQSSVS